MRPRKRFGQHFLAPAWADKVVDAIAPASDDRFIEIGPGPGALTLRLAPRVSRLTAIEIDRDLASALAPQLPPTADIVTADFLDLDLAPLLASGPVRVAGNLPYNITSPILFKLLGVADSVDHGGAAGSEDPAYSGAAGSDDPAYRDGPAYVPIVDATLMLQREVADRLVARPGTKDYGVLTIFTTTRADVERVLTLPPGAFRPVPKVHSTLVRMRFKPSVVPAEVRGIFERMVRSMFTQRRKTLGNALQPFAASVGSSAAAALSTADIDPTRRPETLTLGELAALAAALDPGP